MLKSYSYTYWTFICLFQRSFCSFPFPNLNVIIRFIMFNVVSALRILDNNPLPDIWNAEIENLEKIVFKISEPENINSESRNVKCRKRISEKENAIIEVTKYD